MPGIPWWLPDTTASLIFSYLAEVQILSGLILCQPMLLKMQLAKRYM